MKSVSKSRAAQSQSNFWLNLPKPFFALAPMSDVTDSVFRQLVAKHGKPDVFFTEFVSCAGLCSPNREKVRRSLFFTKKERPIVAQVWGADPAQFYECAELIQALGFDGIDINMGCPDKAVEKQGGGAALMKNPKLAQALIRETKRGDRSLPVSVKTRIGYSNNALDEWLPALLKTGVAAITLHARTRKEMSKSPADWSAIARAVKIRNSLKSKTLIIGNGDVASLEDGLRRAKETGCDGVMVGRAVFGNPWFFNKAKQNKEIPLAEKLRALAEHALLFEKHYGGKKNFAVLRKHFKSYITGFPGAKALRLMLMQTENARQVKVLIKEFSCSGLLKNSVG